MSTAEWERWAEMTQRAGVLQAQLAQVQADLVLFTAELIETRAWAGDGVRSPEHWLMVFACLSPAHARDVVALARRRDELPNTIRQMQEGASSLDQAAVVAHHVPAAYEEDVSKRVPKATVPQLRRLLCKYDYEPPVPPERSSDSVEQMAAAARGESQPKPIDDGPKISVTTVDGRFRLRFESNPLDGALVEQAMREAKDALFNSGQEKATLADAMLELANRSLSAVESSSRREHYKVMVHLETDGRGWVNRKGALPRHVLEHLTCDGQVRPVWQTEGKPVSVGRSQRIVPERTRRLIEDRDGGCRYPGCTASGFLENHHIQHWSKGGATDMDTLVSLCPSHHREHHQDRFTIEGTAATPDGLVFRAPGGWPIQSVRPESVPPPEHPPPAPTPHRGTRMSNKWVILRPSPPPVGEGSPAGVAEAG